jgi:hypothetical protein
VSYETEQPGLILTRTPFVGRDAEMSKLNARLAEARSGHGGLVMLVGEPGIGKSRMIDEFTENARNDGAAVLIGACFEGEWSPPYAPFVEAIENYVKTAEPAQLRADLGFGAAPIARLVPALREVLPDIPEPAALQPDEERFRLLDAVSQMLVSISNRQPVVLVLDDLHWAERGTIAMLRHVARFVPRHQTLILGAYRDVELDRQHPLADALSQLRREVEYERIALKGLNEEQIGNLLTAITEHEVPEPFVRAISEETDGNPFFIREVLIHLADEGKIFQQDGRWTSNLSIEEMGIPEGIRQVIGRRLSRLPDVANKLLTAAAGFNGPFRLDIAAAAAGIDEDTALDAIDAALESQLVRASSNTEIFEFTHALIRHTLYGELSPPRQVRLHRQIAEAMERVYGDRAADHAPELAYQFHRSAGLPGTERGADYALAAAAKAEATAAWDETVTFLEIALELLPELDSRRGPVSGRLAIAQAWALRPDDAERSAASAASLIAETEGRDAAADFLAEAQSALAGSGHTQTQWRVAALGLQYISSARRDLTWARLAAADLRREESEDPDNPGIPLPSPRNTEILNVLMASEDPLARELRSNATLVPAYTTRAEAQAYVASEKARAAELKEIPEAVRLRLAGVPIQEAVVGTFTLGDVRSTLPSWVAVLEANDRRGALAAAISSEATIARLHYALGDIAQGDIELERTRERSARFAVAGPFTLQLVAAEDERRLVTGDWSGTQEFIASLGGQQVVENRWAAAAIVSGLARAFANIAQHDTATALIPQVLEPIERAPGTAVNYPRITSSAAEALWITQRTDHIEVIEKALREKVVGPDIRYPNVDGRLDLARLCALKGDYAEASEWFAKARVVLDEQGARPLRSIVDYDEALMYTRRNADGDRARALPLLETATQQFKEIGMYGWLTRAEELRTTLNA